MKRQASERERVVLVGLARSSAAVDSAESSLDELEQLAATAGAETVGRMTQVRTTPDPATYVGKGKAKEVVEMARALHADAIIFDDELSPAQGRNLEDVAAVNPLAPDAMKIIDRTGLILDVFASHARSTEGKLQVELAQVNYLIPRLRGWGEVLSRIGGAASARGGGSAGGRAPMGTRGPGETQLEVDRRRIQRRLTKLKKDLAEVERARNIKRRSRESTGVPTISLVGYTNAGKSTLLNALTGADELVEDQLFSTLDPVTRKLVLPDGSKAVITDTVGFVRKLPHQVVEAFKSTLEETVRADLLLHVVDISHPEAEQHLAAVEQVLSQIGAPDTPRVLALNKCDLLEEAERPAVLSRFPDGVPISASQPEGLDLLAEKVSEGLLGPRSVAEFQIPFSRGDLRSFLHDREVVLEETHSEQGTRIKARVTIATLSRLDEFLAS